jgi:purine-cytosine permease-like protein
LNVTASNNISDWNIPGIFKFGISCFGFSLNGCPISADYNTYFPEDTSQLKIFFLTSIGIYFSRVPLQFLGAAVYTGTYTNQNWSRAYEMDNAGGLLGASMSTLGGFRKLLLALFSLSTIACIIPAIYSLSLSAQVIAPIFKRIPRVFYTVIGTVIYTILGILAANTFNSSLVSFIDLMSSWTLIFIVIVFEEHFIFRRCSYRNYDFDIWNNRKALPISLAAIASGLIGFVGIALGISRSWYQGPISKAISGNSEEYGLDLGSHCGFIFTAITFPLFRFTELHFIER